MTDSPKQNSADGPRRGVSRSRFGAVATFVAAIVVASPAAASAGDYASGPSGHSHKSAASSHGLQQAARDQKRPSRPGNGGVGTNAAWGS